LLRADFRLRRFGNQEWLALFRQFSASNMAEAFAAADHVPTCLLIR